MHGKAIPIESPKAELAGKNQPSTCPVQPPSQTQTQTETGQNLVLVWLLELK
jgi:hypothetical protein